MDKRKNLKYVIFDFDGTIGFLGIDYTELRKNLNEYFSKFKLSSDFVPLLDEIERLSSRTSDPNRIKQEAIGLIDSAEIKAANCAKLRTGTQETLATLSDSMVEFAVVTRNCRECVLNFFNKNNLPNPKFIISREDVQKVKPHPEQLQLAMSKFNAVTNDCLVVGDTYHDKEMAEKLKVEYIILDKVQNLSVILKLIQGSDR